MSRKRDLQVDAVLDEVLERHPREPESLISVLQDVNKEFRYLPEKALRSVSDQLDVPLNRVYHAATFYSAFTLEPRGKHIIRVCMGTACHVRGAPKILEELSRRLGIASGETSADGEFTLETVNCLGACAIGPIVVLDGDYYGQMTPNKLRKLIQSVRGADKEVIADA